MTAVTLTAYRPLTHRLALKLGRVLTEWATRPLAREPHHVERVELVERSRESAARTLPQLPR